MLNSFKANIILIYKMNTNDNMLSTDPVLNSDIANKGFAILDSKFKEQGWHLIKNDLNRISYSKFGDETSYFDIKILPDKIVVCVPIKNSSYQYVTSFNGYYEASEYLEKRLYDYI
jgi:hypothetical protein